MKISKVSKIFGVPAETLRYIERQGLVHPVRSGDGQYRKYVAGTLAEILDYMSYRKLGLPVKTIKKIALGGKEDPLELIADELLKKEAELGREIAQMELLKKYTEAYRKKLESASCNMGLFRLEKRPQYRFILSDRVDRNGDVYPDDSTLAVRWRQGVPFVRLGYKLEEGETEEPQRMEWILAVEEEYFQALSLPEDERVHVQPEQLSLCTYAEHWDSAEARDCCVPALDYLREQGYRQCGAITVLRLGQMKREGTVVQYVEVIIPVERG